MARCCLALSGREKYCQRCLACRQGQSPYSVSFQSHSAGAAFRDCPAPAPGSLTSSTGEPLPPLAALLAAAPQLSTFRDALRASSLAAVPGGNLTIFAPSNAAFTAALLSGQLWQTLGTSAAAAAGAAGPGTAAPGAAADGTALPQQQATMQALLMDHMAPGRYELADLQQLAACNATGNSSAGGGSGASAAAAPGVAAGPCQGLPLTMLSSRQVLLAVGPDGESLAEK